MGGGEEGHRERHDICLRGSDWFNGENLMKQTMKDSMKSSALPNPHAIRINAQVWL